jgi:hypothetical protein
MDDPQDMKSRQAIPVRIKGNTLFLAGLIAGMLVGATLFYIAFQGQNEPEVERTYDRSEMFFLAVGLYENETHPCPVHVDSCQAEFDSTVLNYTVVSGDDEYIQQDTARTGENGFFDIYLPKGKDYIATFTVEGKTGVGIVSTRKGSSNCITEIQVE